MFFILIFAVCFSFVFIVYMLLINPKVFSFSNRFKEEQATPNAYKEAPEGYYWRKGALEAENATQELHSNLRLLEYLMVMEFTVNPIPIKSLDEVKRFKDYQQLKTEVENRVLKLLNISPNPTRS
jgi:hypothetical protein